MINQKTHIRRFSRLEIFLHWCQATPYIVLFVTGATILLQRVFAVEYFPHRALSLLHRTAGVVLALFAAQVLITALFSGRFRTLWSMLLDCLSWRPRDFIWMVKIPLNMVWPRITLPPVGRFNPGEKLHLLFLSFAVPGFVITGFMIMAVPTALGSWVVHTLLFLPACGFICLHLFLSLVNPSTRQALGGIFTGYVPIDYASAHHPLWADIDSKPQTHAHGAVVSWKAVAAAAAVLALLLLCLVIAYGPNRFMARIAKAASRHFRDAITPGLLCASHAGQPETARCQTCHRIFKPIPSSACLACHEKIQQAAINHVGYHGTLKGECRNCHGEHAGNEADIRPLDKATFNHDLARFRLGGKHRALPCDRCHLQQWEGDPRERVQYTGLRFSSCLDCHSNPHGDLRGRECFQCHQMEGGRLPKLLFAHDRDSRFRLEGRHAETPCVKCHQRKLQEGREPRFVLYDIGTHCADCHQDIHGGQFKKPCDACHSPQGWKGRWLADPHGQDTGYPLRGKHRSLECAECHRPPEKGAKLAQARFAGLPHQCEDCHADPHAGQMRTSCAVCHEQEGWKGGHLLFSHDKQAEFALDATHAGLPCASCHGSGKTARYRPLLKTCEACHGHAEKQFEGAVRAREAVVDPHTGRVRCLECHYPYGSKAKFLLKSNDANALCANCHKLKEKKFLHGPVASGACIACHQFHHSDYPNLAYRPEGQECFECHAEMEKSIKEHAYVHKPAVENCRLCHTAHSSDVPLQLKKTGKALCVECHENIGKEIQNAQVPHGALNILDECLNCHGAHTANMPFLLKDKPMNLCLTCHDKEVETPSGRKLQNIKKVLDASQFKHGPIREGDCMACHQTHGSSNFDLLKRYFPQSFYDDFDLKNYALCVSCHEQSLIMQERTTTLTRFRNGNLNLHYVHVHQEVKGRTCRVCHEVHGGNLPANVRKEVPFGKRQWLLPLNVELTETGGRCSGCHRPMRYDRVNPVDNSIQTEEKAETEKQNTGSGP